MQTTKTIKIVTNIRLVSQVFNSHNNNIINISSCVQKKHQNLSYTNPSYCFCAISSTFPQYLPHYFYNHPQPLCSILESKIFCRMFTFWTRMYVLYFPQTSPAWTHRTCLSSWRSRCLWNQQNCCRRSWNCGRFPWSWLGRNIC